MREQYSFNISLSVLNHLGRNLYRNIITVIGEAISNSWDADAHNVWITIDRERNCMSIVDDGTGMSDDDFQEKFLKIGYSKRKGNNYKSPIGRMYIGRKGIGKLALLSCSSRMHIISKTENGNISGGIIDNSSLDQAITDDVNSQDYVLEQVDNSKKSYLEDIQSGTVLYFENISSGIINTVDYIKRAIALYFRFSLYDPSFNIYVNGEQISEKNLSEFADNTQFLWKINSFEEPFFTMMHNADTVRNLPSSMNIKGYIASVQKPSQLKVRGTQEKITIDLFVNGRLREKDILRHIPSARIVESYVYGQIHFDDLDQGNSADAFTSSRESVISDNPQFMAFLDELDRLFKIVIDEWDEYRRKKGNDGDPDNPKVPKKKRKAQELFHAAVEEYAETDETEDKTKGDVAKKTGDWKKDSVVDKWIKELSEEASFDIPSYTDCFIAENLLRRYITYRQLPLSTEAKEEAEKWKKRDEDNKSKANISYDVRVSGDDMFYLDMDHLANFVDKAQDKNKDPGISRSAVIYKPLRDAIGHTSIITEDAKTQLSLEFRNIQARLIKLLGELQDEDKE